MHGLLRLCVLFSFTLLSVITHLHGFVVVCVYVQYIMQRYMCRKVVSSHLMCSVLYLISLVCATLQLCSVLLQMFLVCMYVCMCL